MCNALRTVGGFAQHLGLFFRPRCLFIVYELSCMLLVLVPVQYVMSIEVNFH